MKRLILALALVLPGLAHAADNVIRPQCYEENVNGEVHRHCEVNRPPKAAPRAAPLHDEVAPPPEAHGPPPGSSQWMPRGHPPRPPNYRGYPGPEAVQPREFYPPPYYPEPPIAAPAPPAYAQAGPYQSCVTAAWDGFVEVKDGPNEWSFNIQVLPNGVPLSAATYGYQVPYVWGGEVWVFVQTGALQGWSRLASLSCQ